MKSWVAHNSCLKIVSTKKWKSLCACPISQQSMALKLVHGKYCTIHHSIFFDTIVFIGHELKIHFIFNPIELFVRDCLEETRMFKFISASPLLNFIKNQKWITEKSFHQSIRNQFIEKTKNKNINFNYHELFWMNTQTEYEIKTFKTQILSWAEQ